MKYLSPFIISVFFLFFSACQNDKPQAEVKDERQLSLDSIAAFEKDLHSELEMDLEKADKMIALYLNFSNTYRQDSLTPEYLFRAAEIAMNADRPIDACAYLYRIDSQYKDFDKMPAVIYMLGFVNENMLGDLNSAEVYYNRFLSEYPDHARAGEVRIMLENMHYDDLELVHEFEKNIPSE